MTTWRYIDSYRDAAKVLGIIVDGPVSVALPTGQTVTAELHFPQFGFAKGTLVFDFPASESHASFRDAMRQADGYSASYFGLDDGNICQPSDLAEMLSDWQWNGPEDTKPSWVVDGDYSTNTEDEL